MIVGDTFQHSFEVSNDVYLGFLNIFKDHNPLHTNKAFAATYGFDDVVMHGNILNGFVSNFVGELLPLKNVAIIQQEIKYNLPVYLNNVLSFSAAVSAVHDSVTAVELKFSFMNNYNKKVASGKILIRIL